jgi:HK97 family phage major capsid protein/HK97 family phage prohead protease
MDFPQELTRTATAEITAHPTAERYEFSFSSEYPVDRGWGKEILSHAPGACDTSRLDRGAVNLLYNHDQNELLGIIRGGRIDPSARKGYCTAVFSSEAEAQQRRRQFDEGTLVNVSFRYAIRDWRQQGDDFIVTQWEPLEISLVTVPADPTVGKNRSYNASVPTIKDYPSSQFPQSPQSQGNSAMNPEQAQQPDLEQIRASESQRIRSIYALGEKYKSAVGPKSTDLAERLLNEGATIEAARSQFLDLVTVNQQPIASAPPELGLSTREQKQYSLLRAIRSQITGDWSESGFEQECSREVAKATGRSPQGFFVPVQDLKIDHALAHNARSALYGSRTPYQVAVPSAAGNLVQTSLDTSNFIDMYRNASIFLNLGVRQLTGLRDNVDLPKRLTGSTAYWVGENVGPSESNGTFGLVSLRPKTVGALSSITRLMTLQSSLDIEMLVREDIALTIGTEIDRVIINGSGVAGVPRGILNTAGVGSVSLGTNGGAVSYDSLIDLEAAVSTQNALTGSLAYVTNSKGIAAFKKLKETTGAPLWNGPDAGLSPGTPGTLNGYGVTFTNNVPSNLSKGTGTNLSSIIFGNMRDIFVGEWGVMDLDVNPYATANGEFQAGTYLLRALMTMDVQIARAQSFAVITDMVA